MSLRSFLHRTLARSSIPSTSRSVSSRARLRQAVPPGPTYSRFNPWSQSFSGSWKARALFQSAVYAVGLVTATQLVDSYFFPQPVDKPPRYASRKERKLAIDELRAAFPGVNDVSTDPDTLRTYGFSENSYHPASPHSVVVRPKSTADVVKIVNISRKYRMPIIPYSGATSLEGHTSGTAVLPNGEVIKTRSRARKSAAGFDLTKLFIGAEGTLGIVTEVTLRLAPVFPTKVAMAQFPDVEHAVSAVQELLSTPYGPHIQCVELLDDHMMKAINNAGLIKEPYPVEDTLFFKIQGDPSSIQNTSNVVQSIVKKHGSSRFEFASTEEEAEDMWQNRKYALMSTLAAYPGTRCWTTDVCVPVSRLPQLVYETKKDLADSGVQGTIVGHVGDGNFHALMLFRNEEELSTVNGLVHRLVHRAISLDGTCEPPPTYQKSHDIHVLKGTGEHGVGVGKKEYLTEELGQGTVELMRVIKRAIDPDNLFNPGKVSF
ncbi:hypothetical protein C0992_008779 [Termitomyces sp. T32_za158]|nr:hypothetical protein C0992_008779 [Termitomyces sp. T32_za158]